ncbi:hypothetical protein C8R47DRAFT_920985, partial [Mycena vitilis]
CDHEDLLGRAVPSDQTRSSFGTAVNIRSAFVWKFEQLGLAREPWHLADDGTWKGNPATSQKILDYLYNLHRRKV